MEQILSEVDMSSRKLLWTGVAGPALFTVTWLIEGALRPGYDPIRSWISELALSDRGWIQLASFLISGALIAVFGRGLRAAITEGRSARWGPRAVIAAGAALFAAGVFVIDPGTYHPPGAAGMTWHGILHNIAGPIVFISLAAAAAIYSRRFTRWYGLTTAALVIAFWVAAGVLNDLDHAGVWSPAPAGLLERLSVLTGFAYVAYLAYRASTASSLHPSPMKKLIVEIAGVVEAPVDQVARLVLDPLPHNGYSGTTEVDHANWTTSRQGGWWYRGEYHLEPHDKGTRIVHRVYNVAQRGRWAVPLANKFFIGFQDRTRAGFADQLAAYGAKLACTAYTET
jgi:hypothetical membrane protein